MHLASLWIYPVKSLRGFSVESADVDRFGLVGDRRFMLVDETGRFLTQRQLPRMARITARLDADSVVLSADGAGSVGVSRAADPTAPLRDASFWNVSGLPAEDCGAPAAAWLGDFLGVKCHLVRLGEKFGRSIAQGNAGPEDRVHFADAYPFLAVGDGSLANLNDRLAARGESAIGADRFRPSLIIEGCDAYAEDAWARIRIGGMVFRADKPCARCTITTTDQLTGEQGEEPLRTLAGYRRDAVKPAKVNFGRYLIHETKAGRLTVGDSVHL